MQQKWKRNVKYSSIKDLISSLQSVPLVYSWGTTNRLTKSSFFQQTMPNSELSLSILKVDTTFFFFKTYDQKLLKFQKSGLIRK